MTGSEVFQLVLIGVPTLVFAWNMWIYKRYFRWSERHQGRTMMLLLAMLTLLFGLNTAVGASMILTGGVAEWWQAVSTSMFFAMTITGVLLGVSMLRSRKNPRAKTRNPKHDKQQRSTAHHGNK